MFPEYAYKGDPEDVQEPACHGSIGSLRRILCAGVLQPQPAHRQPDAVGVRRHDGE